MSMALLLTSIAPVITFAAHIAFGNDLTVAEVSFVISSLFYWPVCLLGEWPSGLCS